MNERLRIFMILTVLTALGASTIARASDVDWTVNKLRTYCAACHALGSVRFIYSDKNEDVWNYISAQKAPRSQKIWKDAIVEVLNWPTNSPPPPSPLMDPANNRDWMPKGSKRIDLANDQEGGTSIRRRIISELQNP